MRARSSPTGDGIYRGDTVAVLTAFVGARPGFVAACPALASGPVAGWGAGTDPDITGTPLASAAATLGSKDE